MVLFGIFINPSRVVLLCCSVSSIYACALRLITVKTQLSAVSPAETSIASYQNERL